MFLVEGDGRCGVATRQGLALELGAAHALVQHGLQRVAIADFDVHHGNGTENIFHDEPRVMLCSSFQHPFYPYSGIEGRSERMVNIPLALVGSVALAFLVLLLPVRRAVRFRPGEALRYA